MATPICRIDSYRTTIIAFAPLHRTRAPKLRGTKAPNSPSIPCNVGIRRAPICGFSPWLLTLFLGKLAQIGVNSMA